MNVARILERARRLFPDKAALLFEGSATTYRDLDDMSDRVANGLLRIGVARGERVAVFLPNIPAFVGVYFGIQKIGAVAVAVNVAFKADEATFILNDCGAVAVVTTSALRRHVQSGALPLLRHVIVAEGEAGSDAALDDLIARASPGGPAADMSPHDPAVIFYTTATGGFPKGATLSHQNIVSNVRACTYTLRLHPDDRILLCLPLFYNFGQIAILLPCFDAGATLVLHREYGTSEVVRSIAAHRVTVFFGVPTVYLILADKADPEQLRSVRTYVSAAAPLPPPLAARWHEKHGVVISDWYGMTEASLVAFNHFLKYRPGAIGTPVEGVEMQVVDGLGQPVAPGEQGEIVVRGPNVMLGYWGRPEETGGVITDGWFHTGDMGRVDDDGYFYFEGYLKDMISVGGEKVYPAEVEGVLRQHPDVADAAVFGVPHDVMGEQVRASVVRKEGTYATAEALTAFCQQRLADFKVPRGIDFEPSLPEGPTRAQIKRVLREHFQARLAPGPSSGHASPPSLASIRSWIVGWLCQKLPLEPGAIETDRPLVDYGVTSLLALTLAGDLSSWSGQPMWPLIIWQLPTIELLARHVHTSSARAMSGAADAAEPMASVDAGAPVDLRALSDDDVARLLEAEIDLSERPGP